MISRKNGSYRAAVLFFELMASLVINLRIYKGKPYQHLLLLKS